MSDLDQSATQAIRADRVLLPDGEQAAVLLIQDGLIAGVHPAGSSAAATTLAAAVEVVTVPSDCVLLPGLIDSHVHINEPGRTEWEGFATATAAAAAGGVTTIADMPLNSIPATIDVPSLRIKQAAAKGKLAVDVAFWGGAVPGNLDALPELQAAGVVGFKCFLLPSGVPEFAPLDLSQLHAAMTMIASFGGLLIAHAEDAQLIENAPLPSGRSYPAFLRSRPDEAELSAIQALIDTTRATGCRTHIVHLSSASALPVIAAAKAEGLPVTVETCPHYLTLAAERVPEGGTQFKCCPPIRGEVNREQLWQGLLDGTIDLIVSDHSPCTIEAKELRSGDFGAAWGGIASVQLGLPVIWTEAVRRGLSLSDLLRWMATGPAALLGLTDRGTIEVGRRADLCMFAPDEQFVLQREMLRHRNPISPYVGAQLRGVVRRTWLRGKPITSGSVDGRFVSNSGGRPGD